MRIALRRTIRLALALTALGFSAGSLVSKAVSQEAGWITLFDGKSLDGWDQVGESNWRVEDGAIVVDKMAGKEAGYLVSKKPFKNFIVRVEFWPSDDANSGIISAALIRRRSPTGRVTKQISSTNAKTRAMALVRSPATWRSIQCRRRGASGTRMK
jgi:Domain of Unknown Function (DUF1080).